MAIVEISEGPRHYEMLHRLPQERLISEEIILSANKGDEIPETVRVEALSQAHTVDTFLPILIQRARGLGEPFYTDTLKTLAEMESSLSYARTRQRFPEIERGA